MCVFCLCSSGARHPHLRVVFCSCVHSLYASANKNRWVIAEYRLLILNNIIDYIRLYSVHWIWYSRRWRILSHSHPTNRLWIGKANRSNVSTDMKCSHRLYNSKWVSVPFPERWWLQSTSSSFSCSRFFPIFYFILQLVSWKMPTKANEKRTNVRK